MDLTHIFNEGDISRRGTLTEGEFFASRGMNLADVAPVQERQENRDDIIIALKKASDLMHQGIHGGALASRMAQSVAECNNEEVERRVRASDGLVGTVLVDCERLGDAGEFKRLSGASKTNGHLQYAINCTCDQSRLVKTTVGANLTGNAMDDAFVSRPDEEQHVPVCAKCGLEVLVCASAYTTEDAIQTLRQLVKAGAITPDEGRTILVKASHPLLAVKKAFLYARKKAAKANTRKYSAEVDASGFAMKESDLTIGLQGKVSSPLKIEDTSEAKMAAEIAGSVSMGDIAWGNDGHDLPVDLAAAMQEDLDVDRDAAVDEDWFQPGEMSVEINSNDFEMLDVDERGSFDF